MNQPKRGRPRRLGTETDATEQLKLTADGLWNDRGDLATIPSFNVGRFVRCEFGVGAGLTLIALLSAKQATREP
jgi:hypothetical protein